MCHLSCGALLGTHSPPPDQFALCARRVTVSQCVGWLAGSRLLETPRGALSLARPGPPSLCLQKPTGRFGRARSITPDSGMRRESPEGDTCSQLLVTCETLLFSSVALHTDRSSSPSNRPSPGGWWQIAPSTCPLRRPDARMCCGLLVGGAGITRSTPPRFGSVRSNGARPPHRGEVTKGDTSQPIARFYTTLLSPLLLRISPLLLPTLIGAAPSSMQRPPNRPPLIAAAE